MLEYAMNYPDKLMNALVEHIQIMLIALTISLLLASVLTLCSVYSRTATKIMMYTFSVIYSVPSLALFALLIPLTGLGESTAIIVLVLYNQYLLLRNFIDGLNEVNPAVVEAATGIGMTKTQLFFRIKLPLSKKAIFTGIRLASVSTIGIATIAASINAGGIGTILFDGLRTMNTDKIVWGSLLAGGLAIAANSLLGRIERKV